MVYFKYRKTENGVKLTKKQAIELSKVSEYKETVSGYYGDHKYDSQDEMLEDLFECYENKYYLMFNSDHMEHMDYIWGEEKIKEKLKELKVKGDITFGSLDGDNAGSNWGYRFDGKGGMKTLTGVLTFVEDEVQPA